MTLFDVTHFFRDHWQSVALIISEVAALLPGKYSGILKTFIHLVSCMRKKSANQKN